MECSVPSDGLPVGHADCPTPTLWREVVGGWSCVGCVQ